MISVRNEKRFISKSLTRMWKNKNIGVYYLQGLLANVNAYLDFQYTVELL